MVFLQACSSVKYVEEGKYLVSDVSINVNSKSVSESEIKNNIVQKPNVKIFGFIGSSLALYNMSGRDLSKWYNRWLRTIGEEPVIYNSNLSQRSLQQIKQYLNNIGYYDVMLSDTIIVTGKKRIKQVYNIDLGEAYLVEKLSYFSLDNRSNDDVENIKTLIKQDSLNSLIKLNENVSVDIIEQERLRISRMLRNKGFYNFSERFIHCYIDSSYNDKRVKLFLSIPKEYANNREFFNKYKIRDIDVKLENPTDVRFAYDENISKYDSLEYSDKKFISVGKPYLRTKVLNSAIRFEKGEFYSLAKLEKTYEQLQALKQFKFINIKFQESNTVSLDSAMFVDCFVDLRPLVKQSYLLAADGTSSSGNFGGAAKLAYSHRNLFKGAEDFSVTFTGLYEKESYAKGKSYNKMEFGVESRLVSPQFLLPFGGLTSFRKKFSPKTALSLGYNYQDTYSFKGKTLNSSFGYTWKKGKNMLYNFNLLDVDYIEMKDVDSNFLESLRNETAKNSYKSHFVVASSLGLVYTANTDTGFSNYLRLFVESAGNFANTIASVVNIEKLQEKNDKGEIVDEYKEFWGIRYAQYIKSDVEYIYKYKFNKFSSLVGRVFLGIGFPYGNMKVLPYEKMYFCGGANGLRAWGTKTLGPGSYLALDKDGVPEQYNYANSVSDMKIEANIEYRFKLFAGLEAALFVDAGNIWSINNIDTRKGADFQIDRFYKEIAVGTGLGFRYDFNVVLLRWDIGAKVIDPLQPEGSRFVFMKEGYNRYNNLIFNIAIGYPF